MDNELRSHRPGMVLTPLQCRPSHRPQRQHETAQHSRVQRECAKSSLLALHLPPRLVVSSVLPQTLQDLEATSVLFVAHLCYIFTTWFNQPNALDATRQTESSAVNSNIPDQQQCRAPFRFLWHLGCVSRIYYSRNSLPRHLFAKSDFGGLLNQVKNII